ncbi:MAG: hypothetical protein AAGJ40_09455 [Planctomycetota bacterium]
MQNTWIIPKGVDFQEVIEPQDNTAAAVTGSALPMTDNCDWQIVLNYDASSEAPVIELEQASDAAFTTPVVLGITDIATLSAVDVDAPVDPEAWNYHDEVNRTTPSLVFDSSTALGNSGSQYRVVVRVAEGTVDDGNTHVRVKSTGTATARPFRAVAISTNKSYRG